MLENIFKERFLTFFKKRLDLKLALDDILKMFLIVIRRWRFWNIPYHKWLKK